MSEVRTVRRTFRPARPTSLRLTLGPLVRGRQDPCARVGPDGVWRATRTPVGPGTARYTARAGEITVEAWGPGAAWLAETAPVLVGAHDDDDGFAPADPQVADLRRRFPGLRFPRSQAVFEAAVPSILEQKVIGLEAKRSYRALVVALGEPAPGPAGEAGAGAGLRVPPGPATVAATPSWAFHRWGVERKRADTIRLAARYAHRLEEAVEMDPGTAHQRLTALPGMGPWTAAEVATVALGDADAVSVGDFHLKHQVAFAFTGAARGTDEQMLELLEPYRPHRGRVLRLLALGGIAAPRFGPRLPLQHIAHL